VECRGFLSENFRQSFRELLSKAGSRQNSGVRCRSRQDEGARRGASSGSNGRGLLAIPMNPVGLLKPTVEISAYRTVLSEAV